MSIQDTKWHIIKVSRFRPHIIDKSIYRRYYKQCVLGILRGIPNCTTIKKDFSGCCLAQNKLSCFHPSWSSGVKINEVLRKSAQKGLLKAVQASSWNNERQELFNSFLLFLSGRFSSLTAVFLFCKFPSFAYLTSESGRWGSLSLFTCDRSCPTLIQVTAINVNI